MDGPKSEKKLRPRTTEERHAFMDGYASAMIDIMDHGIESAAEWLREMAVSEYGEDWDKDFRN